VANRADLAPHRHIADPVHGRIELTKLETAVVDTPVFQRLRRVAQAMRERADSDQFASVRRPASVRGNSKGARMDPQCDARQLWDAHHETGEPMKRIVRPPLLACCDLAARRC
jgi:hypothetical protein